VRVPQRIVFGQNPNQTRHAFRYTDRLGFDRDIVMEAIVADLQPNLPLRTPPPRNAPFIGTVSVDGAELRYHAYAVSEGLVNVGRIVAP
jgi:hypothetical protein